MKKLCHSCEKEEMIYVDGLCEKCHQVAMDYSDELEKRIKMPPDWRLAIEDFIARVKRAWGRYNA